MSGKKLSEHVEVGDLKERGHQEVSVRKRGGRMHGKHSAGHLPQHGKTHEQERAKGGRAEEREEEREEHEKERKHGGRAKGDAPPHHLAKRKRGGRMTPSEPLSGADAPNLAYARGDVPAGSPRKDGHRD